MTRDGKAAGAGHIGGGERSGNANTSTNANHTTDRAKCKAPCGNIPARAEGGTIYLGSQHVSRVVGHELQRTLDLGRETFDGSIMFRCDVLALARSLGATTIVCTDRATKDRYQVTLADFDRLGWLYNNAKHGLQKGLPLDRWQRRSVRETQGTQVQQLDLFGGDA